MDTDGIRLFVMAADIVDQEALVPLLDEQVFTLEDVGQAYDRLSSGQAMGKVVVEI